MDMDAAHFPDPQHDHRACIEAGLEAAERICQENAARLTPDRRQVLEILLRRGGNVAPKRLFEDQLFGLSGDVGSNAVEVYVHRLRKMLGDAGANVRVHTVRGVGYLMAEEKAG